MADDEWRINARFKRVLDPRLIIGFGYVRLSINFGLSTINSL